MRILDWLLSRVKGREEKPDYCFGCGEPLGATRVIRHGIVYCSGSCAGWTSPKTATDQVPGGPNPNYKPPAPCKGGPRSPFAGRAS